MVGESWKGVWTAFVLGGVLILSTPTVARTDGPQGCFWSAMEDDPFPPDDPWHGGTEEPPEEDPDCDLFGGDGCEWYDIDEKGIYDNWHENWHAGHVWDGHTWQDFCSGN